MRTEIGMKSGIEIFVVDEDPVSHEILSAAFVPEGLLIKSFLNGSSFLAASEVWRAACILLDIDVTDQSGNQIWSGMNARLFAAPILITSKRHEVASVVDAIKKGAFDFIVKPFKVVNVVGRVHEAIERFRRHYPDCDPLTPREQQVLSLIAGGSFNKEMSRDLGISFRTIEVHRAHIMRKLHARNAADLVRIALSSDNRI